MGKIKIISRILIIVGVIGVIVSHIQIHKIEAQRSKIIERDIFASKIRTAFMQGEITQIQKHLGVSPQYKDAQDFYDKRFDENGEYK